MDYINKPIGKGIPVPGPLKTMVALPTTAGTGAETTATAIMDVLASEGENRHLKPLPAALARNH